MANRFLVAVLIGLGLMGLSIALGTLYLGEVEMSRAALEAELRGETLEESGQEALLATFDNPARFWTALVSGTVGVGMLGVGGVLALYQLASAWPGGRTTGRHSATDDFGRDDFGRNEPARPTV